MQTNTLVQVGILVRDIEKAAAAWARFLGLDMPEISLSDGYDITKAQYHGKPCYGRIYQAVFELNNIEIELIAPADDEASYWRDSLDEKGEGLHHIAFRTADMDSDLAQSGRSNHLPIQTGEWKAEPENGRYGYIDTTEDLKVTIELLQM